MQGFIDTIQNVNMQIQRKRRQNQYNGLWGSANNFFGNLGNNQWQGQNNNGWGQQDGWQNDNGWGQNNNNGWGGNVYGQNTGQFGLEMALLANKNMWGNNMAGFDWVLEQCKRQAFDIVKTGQNNLFNLPDVVDILEKQITMIEPSPAQKKLQQLKREGKKFLDERFPPNQDSLCGEWKYESEWSQIKWKTISQIMPTANIFKDRVQPSDIAQGYLGDCYFLAGLAALAERPDRIFSLFLLKETNTVKYFSVKIIYKGKWMTIDMDEYFPTLYGKLAFSKAIDNELWVALLEKAWAKLYTSYKRIEAGYPQEALHDLTGAPIKNIYMKQAGFDKEAEWNYLLMASQRQYAMVASSKPGSDQNKSEAGIVLGHAYTFLNATVLHFEGGSDRIVQLRNPWGKGQSKGRWCDDDPMWNRVPYAEKQRIGFTKNSSDGIFFMTYDAFIQQFRALTVAQINDNASYIYKSMKDRNIEGVYFKIQIFQSGYYSFHVDKTPERSFEDRIQNQYQYPQARLDLGKLNGNYCQKLQSCVSMRRTLFKGYELQPGVYIAYVKISFDRRFEKDFDINLAVYAQYACQISIATRDMVIAFTGNPNVKWNPIANNSLSNDWNPLGNSSYRGGGSNNINSRGNNGWSNDNGWGSNDNGWGTTNNTNNNGWGTSNNNNNGWGNDNTNNNNNGWGNDNGWGTGDTNNNNGWGNDNGWGTNLGNKPNNQPKNTNNNNNGWDNDNGWGIQPNNNNGWGTNNNNGWGNGW